MDQTNPSLPVWAAGAHSNKAFSEKTSQENADSRDTQFANNLGNEVGELENDLVRQSVKKVIDAALDAVDRRLDAISKQTQWSPVFAVPKDPVREKLSGFHHAGEFWSAVAAAGTPGRSLDHRLVGKTPLGLHSMDGADGGFLVPETIGEQILEIVYNDDNLLARTDSQSIAGNSITLKTVDDSSRVTGSRRGGVRGYWLAEADQYVSSRPKFREILLKPHKLGVFYYATDEELGDSTGLALERKLAQYAAEEINWLINEAIVAGDGVQKPLGIMNSPAMISVAKESGQAAATIVYPNIVKMYARMLPRSINNAVWLINADCMPQLLAMAFPNATGTVPAFVNGNFFPSASDAPQGTLLGRPIVITEHNPTVGTLGDIIFADLSMYKTATRGSLRSTMSIHVRFDYGESAFRFDFRIDGQPWLNAPVTPAKSASTLSPFVALQTR